MSLKCTERRQSTRTSNVRYRCNTYLSHWNALKRSASSVCVLLGAEPSELLAGFHPRPPCVNLSFPTNGSRLWKMLSYCTTELDMALFWCEYGMDRGSKQEGWSSLQPLRRRRRRRQAVTQPCSVRLRRVWLELARWTKRARSGSAERVESGGDKLAVESELRASAYLFS